jgi:uncharacterized protein YdiU (UPF0061 family)
VQAMPGKKIAEPTGEKTATSAEERKRRFRAAHPLMVRRSMEGLHAAIARMMEEKEFKSIKEANAFLANMNEGADLPDSRPPAIIARCFA